MSGCHQVNTLQNMKTLNTTRLQSTLTEDSVRWSLQYHPAAWLCWNLTRLSLVWRHPQDHYENLPSIHFFRSSPFSFVRGHLVQPNMRRKTGSVSAEVKYKGRKGWQVVHPSSHSDCSPRGLIRVVRYQLLSDISISWQFSVSTYRAKQHWWWERASPLLGWLPPLMVSKSWPVPAVDSGLFLWTSHWCVLDCPVGLSRNC